MSGPSSNEREEILRLREENLRMRERELAARKSSYSSSKTDTQIVNVKQVNESFLSGCAGLIGVFFVIVTVLGKCSG